MMFMWFMWYKSVSPHFGLFVFQLAVMVSTKKCQLDDNGLNDCVWAVCSLIQRE